MTPAMLARRRSYHVGNVRGQLLAAARDILAESGRGALSLRAIAERAGVAPGTVYYHYVDKAALLAGLAVDGFRQLADAMRLAYAADPSGGGLRTTGGAYLAFLRERRELYELMYEARDSGRDDVAAAEAEAIAVSREAIMADYQGLYPEDIAHDMAEAIWAWGRGIAAVGLARGADGADRGDEAVQAAVRGLTALIARA
ncbi:TetR/AcrR family transcriptional regulator [Phenylobacterium sp.]|uniref:TetR/AcrR family transcriptional regulator n=1 Tax=Phenylobacterium sp. TaxID=1871053 RepID=UPI00273371DA|nr:TetR/AcrR family transcriptional regulator [Phenylobacterium sp.]MDP3854229.1 TetR/AcrR family transcriptional regulator [Phenylobacterium sp.]